MHTRGVERSEIIVGDGTYCIRPASKSDVREIVAMLRDDRLGSGRESADWTRYEAAFDEINADPNQLLVIVEDAGGVAVGTMQLTLIPGLSRNAAKRLQIEAVRIAAATRGTGLGTAMIEWAHAFGRERGASLAQLTSDKSRGDALRFYAALGYSSSHEGFKREL